MVAWLLQGRLRSLEVGFRWSRGFNSKPKTSNASQNSSSLLPGKMHVEEIWKRNTNIALNFSGCWERNPVGSSEKLVSKHKAPVFSNSKGQRGPLLVQICQLRNGFFYKLNCCNLRLFQSGVVSCRQLPFKYNVLHIFLTKCFPRGKEKGEEVPETDFQDLQIFLMTRPPVWRTH